MMERAQQELKLMLAMMKDAIRMGLLKHELQFDPVAKSKKTRVEYLGQLSKLVNEALEHHENGKAAKSR